jgi:uncharacterized membrane protein
MNPSRWEGAQVALPQLICLKARRLSRMDDGCWSRSGLEKSVSTAAGAHGTKKVPLAPYFMLAFALVGIAVAVYVAHGSYTGAPLWCPIIDGCNTVVNSPYSRVFGVPMSYFGFIYFLYMFALAALLAFDPFSRGLRFRAVLYAAMGMFSSMYFMYLQLGFIREVCSYCLISAITTLLLFIAALWHWQATRIDPTTAAKMRALHVNTGSAKRT